MPGFDALWANASLDGASGSGDDWPVVPPAQGDDVDAAAAAGADAHGVGAPGGPVQGAAMHHSNWFRQRLRVQRLRSICGAELSRTVANHAALAACTNPAKARYISSALALNTGKAEIADVVAFADDTSTAAVVDRTKKQRLAYGHALVGHLEGVKASFAPLLQDSGHVVITKCSGDASMWCRLPPDELKKAATRDSAIACSKAPAKGRGKGRGKRAGRGWAFAVGKNKRTPFMTTVQHAFLKQKGPRQGLRKFQLHSPSISTPRANWRSRLMSKKRSAWTGAGLGSQFLPPGASASDVAADTSIVMEVSTADKATTNTYIFAAAEEAATLAKSSAQDRVRLNLRHYCKDHSECLVKRPAAKQSGSMKTTLIWLGDIFGSSRQWSLFEGGGGATNSATTISNVWRFSPCLKETQEFREDRVYANAIMERATPAL